MTASIEPKATKLHPVLQGLSEQQLTTVYTDEYVRTLGAGENLFTEGVPADTVYLIIRGSIQIQETRGETIFPLTVIEENGAISSVQFSAEGCRTAAAIAQEALTVLALDDTSLGKIDLAVQAILFRNMEKLLAGTVNRMFSEQENGQRENIEVNRELTQLLLSRTDHYASSGAIKSLLDRVPKLPPYASELTSMLLGDNVSVKDAAELARLDPSLTGAVLKTVNSSYYGLTHKVTDFQHASILLGFNQIYQIIINLGIQNTMPKTGQFKRLQNHSILISIICFEISQITGEGKGPVLSTIGLLHDIGKSVLLLLIKQNPKLAFFIGLLDNARIGALLLRNWDIPEVVYRTLEYQNYPEIVPPSAIPGDIRKNVAVLYLAHLCHDYLAAKSGHQLNGTFLKKYLSELGSRKDSVSAFVEGDLLPAVKKRLGSFPVEVQDFFNNAGAESEAVDKTENKEIASEAPDKSVAA